MIISYFSVFDEKSAAFGAIFPAPTAGAAERAFADSLKNPESMAGKYPEDFALYRVFDFDDSAGIVTESFSPPQLIVRASALVVD